REGKNLLKTPEISLDIGQKYVEDLLNNGLVGQDLLSLAIAYNAGPGNLQKWKNERADMDDPLLFIETIPYAETRTYVERVLSNYWIYRMRFDQSNESMTELAQGRWARYAALDKGAVKFAAAD
ncbi:MAG: transglycosylase, partial [Micavibrio aeruginosavorus]